MLFLKCSIPVFEGLLPEPHNTKVLNLLFALAHWHALAKLRQHTDPSLVILEAATINLGKLLRDFRATTCTAYKTQELPREMAARVRKAASKPLSSKPTELDSTTGAAKTAKTKKAAGRLPKSFNLKTYKDHSLGDYVESIRQNGTVDSYSTESASRIHVCLSSLCLHNYRWNWSTGVQNHAIFEQAARILKNNWVVLSDVKLAFVESVKSWLKAPRIRKCLYMRKDQSRRP